MANFIRSAKSGSNWSNNELLAFNIRVTDAGVAVFFNTPELPLSTVSATTLANIDKPDEPLIKDDRLFFQYMKMVENPCSPDSRVGDFAAFLLHIMNYDDEDRVICQRTEISFPMAGQRVDAETDVCLMNDLELLLLVQDRFKYIPAITMIDTAPIFYSIPITTMLLEALTTATYPQEETTVLRFIPSVPNQERYCNDGMHPLVNRRTILQCFEGFKAVIN